MTRKQAKANTEVMEPTGRFELPTDGLRLHNESPLLETGLFEYRLPFRQCMSGTATVERCLVKFGQWEGLSREGSVGTERRLHDRLRPSGNGGKFADTVQPPIGHVQDKFRLRRAPL